MNRKSPAYEELECRLAEAEDALRIFRSMGLDKVEAAQDLRDSREILARTERIAHLGSWGWDIAEDRVRWSEELFRIFQRDPARGSPSFAEHPNHYVVADMNRLRQAVRRCVTDGTGLELATVYGIIKQNRGVYPGRQRTRAGHNLPHLPARPFIGGSPAGERAGCAHPGSGENETILLVEDERVILKLTNQMLERLGYVILAADTPAGANSSNK